MACNTLKFERWCWIEPISVMVWGELPRSPGFQVRADSWAGGRPRKVGWCRCSVVPGTASWSTSGPTHTRKSSRRSPPPLGCRQGGQGQSCSRWRSPGRWCSPPWCKIQRPLGWFGRRCSQGCPGWCWTAGRWWIRWRYCPATCCPRRGSWWGCLPGLRCGWGLLPWWWCSGGPCRESRCPGLGTFFFFLLYIFFFLPIFIFLGSFYLKFHWIFFYKEILCKIFPLQIYKGIPSKLVDDLQQKNLQKNSL